MIPNRITIHCTATKPSFNCGADVIDQMHKARGWSMIGYHYVIRRNGMIEEGRPESRQGAGVRGHNSNNLHISWEGGLNEETGKPEDNRTDEQKIALVSLIRDITARYSIEDIRGHRDYSPDLDGDGVIESFEWLKACPCFNAIEEYGHYTCL